LLDGSDFSNYTKAGGHIIDLAIAASKKLDYFPVWNVCNGIELLGLYISGNHSVLQSDFNDPGVTHPLTPLDKFKTSRLFSEFSQDEKDAIISGPLSYFHHRSGFHFNDWVNDEKLMNFFDILTTSKDQNGEQFISAVEAKNYPIYAVQFHPEKNPYEWNVAANHTEMA